MILSRITLLAAFAGVLAVAQAAALRVVPSYENASVYVDSAGHTPGELTLTYREKGGGAWLQGHLLSASEGEPTPRASLFGLKQNTAYEVRCAGPGGAPVAAGEFKTWADEVPVARTINVRQLSPDGGPVLIDVGGRPDGWVRYVADPGFVINGGDTDDEAVLVEGVSYVILDGLTVRGGRRHGIQVRKSQHVRIRNCDIAGFGRVGVQDLARQGKYYMPGDKRAVNWDAGVYVDLSGNLTIERCYIHDPRGHANSWFYSHPEGPNAIFVRSTGGMVIRHNDLIAGDGHRWNDVIEGYGNSNADGGFNKDGDIYGNFLAFPNDDGIELDGGQMNVRFYGNKVEGGLCGISTAPNFRGPTYIFNNLVVNLGEERGAASAAVKNGGGSTNSKGTTFFYHNTFLTLGHGVSGVGFGSDKNRGMFLGHTRNNVFATGGAGINDGSRAPGNTYDHDLFAGALGGPGEYDIPGEAQAHGVVADAGFVDGPGGVLALGKSSPGRGAGMRVAGLGAFQSATGPVSLGVWTDGTMPDRPVAARLDKGQLFLTAYGDGASAEVRLSSLAPEGSRPMPFRVLKNDTAGWLQVSPASGVLNPGDTLSLTVGLQADGQIGRGLLHGAAIVKFDDGLSVPLTVYGIAARGPFRRLFEAEQLPGREGFTTLSDTGASGGRAVRLVDPQAGKSGQGSRRLVVDFEAPADGAYYVTFRVRCAKPYGNHDSLFVSVNDAKPTLSAVLGTGVWGWSRLTGKTMHLQLSAGPNRVSLIPREELDVDAVLIGDRPLMAGDDVQTYLHEHRSP